MRVPKALTGLFLLLVFTVPPESAFAGKLDRASNEVRGKSASSSSSSSKSSKRGSLSSYWDSNDSNDNNDSDVDPFMGAYLAMYAIYYTFLGVTSPWWAPHYVLEGEQPVGSTKAVRFADYPYADGAVGHLVAQQKLTYGWDGIARTSTGDKVEPRLLQKQAFQLRLESGIGVSDAIARFGVNGRIQLPMRLQFDTDWSMFREFDQHHVDVAYLGREHLSIRFAQSSRIQFYSGIGPQHFCDAQGCVHGVDFTYGFEAFPGRPIAFRAEGSIGNLDHAFAPGLRASLGYLVGPIEATLGWHQRWIGDVPLGGPFLGLGGWF